MIILKPEETNKPIRLSVGNIKAKEDRTSGTVKMALLLSAGSSTYQADLTGVLLGDLTQLFETHNTRRWFGREAVFYAEGGEIRARAV